MIYVLRVTLNPILKSSKILNKKFVRLYMCSRRIRFVRKFGKNSFWIGDIIRVRKMK